MSKVVAVVVELGGGVECGWSEGGGREDGFITIDVLGC